MSAFAEPLQAGEWMADFARPWYVAGGWALDLFLGRVTRPHEDVDIAILREDQAALHAYLAGWELRKVVAGPEGGVLVPWPEGERLELPVHEIHGRRARGAPATLEVLLNEAAGEMWRFRRNLEITRPLARIGLRAASGLPFLAPEIALLYKAKSHQAKDDEDFRTVLPALDAEGRAWLRRAIRACHPGHPWLAEWPVGRGRSS